MKRMFATFLTLLLISLTLFPLTTAEVLTIDLDNATYDELVAAYELLKAERIARLKETFTQTYVVEPADGITFRGVPWGSTRVEAEAILGAHYASYPYAHRSINSIYNDGRGISTSYNDWTVAGYELYCVYINYIYPVLDGRLLRDNDLAIMCEAMYWLNDLGNVSAVMDDLTNKLNALYGSYISFGADYRRWTDQDGNSIKLQSGSNSVYLFYCAADKDHMMNAAVQAIADERAEQEELLRLQNQNNTEGL